MLGDGGGGDVLMQGMMCGIVTPTTGASGPRDITGSHNWHKHSLNHFIYLNMVRTVLLHIVNCYIFVWI